MNLTFIDCEQSTLQACRSGEEIDSFLDQHKLMILTSESFIDFEAVLSEEQTL